MTIFIFEQCRFISRNYRLYFLKESSIEEILTIGHIICVFRLLFSYNLLLGSTI